MSVPDYRKTIDELAATPDGSILTKASGAITSMTGVTWTQAGVLSLPGRINLPTTTGADVGVLSVNGVRFLHGFGTQSVFAGLSAGNFTLTGSGNAGLGDSCLTSVTSGGFNTGVGRLALNSATSAFNCVGVGANSLRGNITGSNNTGVGSGSGFQLADGVTTATDFTSGTYLGFNTRVSANGVVFETVVGSQALGGGSNTVTLGRTSDRVHVFNMRVYNGWTDPDNGQWLQLDNPNSSWTRISAQANGTGATNISIAISPRGNGSISAHVPDNTATGGNSRGSNSVDLSTIRGLAEHVASGSQSVVGGGISNTASGLRSVVAGGISNQATGSSSTVSGGASNISSGSQSVVSGGASNVASGSGSWIPGGLNGNTRGLYGFHSWSGSVRNTSGDTCHIGTVLSIGTADATPTILTSTRTAADSTNVMVLPNNSSWSGLIDIQGRDTSGNVVTFLFKIIAKRGANAAATVIPHWTLITFYRDAALSTVPQPEILADTTLGAWVIRATGLPATTIDWIADVTVGSLTHR